MKKCIGSFLIASLASCSNWNNLKSTNIISPSAAIETEVISAGNEVVPAGSTLTPTKESTATATPTAELTKNAPDIYPLINGISRVSLFSDGGGWLNGEFQKTIEDQNTYTGLWHTDDGGINWIDVLPPESLLDYYQFVVLDSRHAWIYGDDFFIRTIDGGRSWVSLPVFISEREIAASSRLSFIDKNKGWVIYKEVMTGSYDVRVKTTNDGGMSWNPFPLTAIWPLQQVTPSIIKLSGLCDDTFYIDDHLQIIIHGATNSCSQLEFDDEGLVAFTMHVTKDNGNTWKKKILPLTESYSTFTGFSPDVGVHPWSPIFFSLNNGILPIHEFDISDPGNVSLVIYDTDDGGDTWATNGTELKGVHYRSIQTLSSDIYIVICGDQLCITKDGAKSWQEIPFSRGTPVRFSFSSPEDGVVVSIEPIAEYQGSAYILWKTSDGGNNWVQIDLPIRNK